MPNWFHNKLKIIGNREDISKALNFISSEKGVMDLNKIISMPADLQLSDHSLDSYCALFLFFDHLELYHFDLPEAKRYFAKMLPPNQISSLKQAVVYCDNINKYGYATSYTWSMENWGTKWNVIEAEISQTEENTIHYDSLIRFHCSL